MPAKDNNPNLNEISMIWEHNARIFAIETTLKNIKDVSADVAVIKNITENTDKKLDKLVISMEKIDDRVTKNENDISKQGERVGIVAGIQTVVTILISTVVAFVKRV